MEENEYGFARGKDIIMYRADSSAQLDTYTYGVIKVNQPDFLLVSGLEKDERLLRFAVSGLVPLGEWLQSEDGKENFKKIQRLAESLVDLFSFFEEYTIPVNELILRTDTVFYDAGKDRLRFLCLPLVSETAEKPHLSQFFPAVLCSAEYTNDRQKILAMDIAGFSATHTCGDNDNNSISDASVYSVYREWLSELHEKLRAAATADTAVKRKKISSFLTRIFSAQGESMSDDEFFMSEEAPSSESFSVLTCRSTGAQYPLVFGPDYLGTDPEICSICVDREQENDKDEIFCMLSAKRGKWFLKNVSENEKIFINGEETVPGYESELRPADLITIGKNDFVFSDRN